DPFPMTLDNPKQKTGSPSWAPRRGGGVSLCLLEIHLQPELQATHRRAKGQTVNASSISSIHVAGRPVVVNMVEDIVGVELELGFEALSYTEALEDREVGVPILWASKAVASDISKSLAARLAPRTGGGCCGTRADVGSERDAPGGLKPVAWSLYISGTRSIFDRTD